MALETRYLTPAPQVATELVFSDGRLYHEVHVSCISLPSCKLDSGCDGGHNLTQRMLLQEALQALGPLGPAAFVVTIGICECIPFFPTQPLSICAGLLFGAGSGAALNLLGLSIASSLAFTLSRTVGRGLAQAVIKAETGGEDGQSKDNESRNPVAVQIEKAQTAIENGGPLQQFTAILLLRLTPIVPFSASNYVLGLTPVPYGPFIGATVAGSIPSSTLYYCCRN